MTDAQRADLRTLVRLIASVVNEAEEERAARLRRNARTLHTNPTYVMTKVAA